MRELELRMEQHSCLRTTRVPPATLEEFAGLAEELEEVWNSPQSDARLKKRIVRARCMKCSSMWISETNEVIARHSLARRGAYRTARAASATRKRHADCDRYHRGRAGPGTCATDEQSPAFLNRNNLKTGRGNRWTKERITSLRSYHQIPRYCPETKEREGWLTLTEASRLLSVSSRTLRLAAERGDIPGQHPLPDGPWVFRRADLQTPIAQQLVQKTRQHRGKHPAVPSRGQKTLGFSGT